MDIKETAERKEKGGKASVKEAVHWAAAMLLCPLGVCFTVRGGLGVSMIEAPVFVLYHYISQFFPWYTFGTSEYVVQGILLILLCFAVKKFEPRYLLSFVTAFLYGKILDGWQFLFGSEVFSGMAARLAFTSLGILITAFAVALFFRTSWPLEVWELFVKELTDHYHLNMTKTKWIYDLTLLFIGIGLMLFFFHRFDFTMIGPGTIVTAFINAPIIGFWGKWIDRLENKRAVKE